MCIVGLVCKNGIFCGRMKVFVRKNSFLRERMIATRIFIANVVGRNIESGVDINA